MRGSFTRREVLIGMGAAGMTPLLINGCSDGGSAGEPLPDRVEYEWDGALGSKTLFEHGVASGDPLSDGVIIWTRVSPENVDADLPEAVFWEMALDEDFQQQTAAGRVETDAARDFTVKIDVSGLKWGRNYYYRFALQGRWSPTGRTRLAPKADEASQLRFGVCACSSYARGWFHAYRHMASRSDLDAVLHLGDYFYEYGDGKLDEALGPVYRLVEPPHETVTLEDYRLRFSQHRRDRDCQECHRQHPFIVVWDDHESANNSWMGGAENHDEGARRHHHAGHAHRGAREAGLCRSFDTVLRLDESDTADPDAWAGARSVVVRQAFRERRQVANRRQPGCVEHVADVAPSAVF